MHDVREIVKDAKRVVIKIGSRVLVNSRGRPDRERIAALVKEISHLHASGREVIVVSSGAIAAGLEALGLKRRPSNLPDLQMAAAVGQSRLVTLYQDCFAKSGLRVGQVLLTRDDLQDRERHLNARNTIMSLLRHDVIPIVNENDVVTVEEIKLGDNDLLASLVAVLVNAEVLLMLTSADGLRQPLPSGRSRRVSHLSEISDEVKTWVKGKSSGFAVGGMATKLEASKNILSIGSLVVIAHGRKKNVISDVFAGMDVGTVLGDGDRTLQRSLRGKKSWIAFFQRVKGALVVDEGARRALEKKGKSLLPVGVAGVEGQFPVGSLVNIKAEDGVVLGKGLVEYSSEQIVKIQGCKTSEIFGILGEKFYDEVIHRDNMAIGR